MLPITMVQEKEPNKSCRWPLVSVKPLPLTIRPCNARLQGQESQSLDGMSLRLQEVRDSNQPLSLDRTNRPQTLRTLTIRTHDSKGRNHQIFSLPRS
jgi:hypothetical protein